MLQTSASENITQTNQGFFSLRASSSFPYNAAEFAMPGFAIALIVLAMASIIANVSLFMYIIFGKIYKRFVSSQFIAHLCMTNVVALLLITPMLSYSFWTGLNPWANSNGMCRIQAFLMCSVWSVVHYMILCIAGVHVLTFARMHYDQLFGLEAPKLCILSWLVAFAVALPCITNGHIVIYDPVLRTCIWSHDDNSYKFLTYFIILGVLIPMIFVYYAYLRALTILYHSPIVFQSLGLYKARYLVFAFLLGPFYQIPVYVISMMDTQSFSGDSYVPLIATILGFTQLFITPLLYGLSLTYMKEEDMVLSQRAQKNTGPPNPYQQIHHGYNL